MLKLAFLILSVFCLPTNNRLRTYLRLLESLEGKHGGEEPVGETADVLEFSNVKSQPIKDQSDPVYMPWEKLGDAVLDHKDIFGDFRNYLHQKAKQDSGESALGEVGDLYDEDELVFYGKRQIAPSKREQEDAVGQAGGYPIPMLRGRRMKCEVGDQKVGWMPREYSVNLLKLKATCAAECAASPDCMAFSWDFSVPMNARGECTFKKYFDRRKLIGQAGFGSWGTVVVRCPPNKSRDWYGKPTCTPGDYHSGYMPGSATIDLPKLKQECQLECLNSDRCMAFSWNFALDDTQMGVCHFKRFYNEFQVRKLDSWGTVVVRCPPTTTTTGKPEAAEMSVAHHGHMEGNPNPDDISMTPPPGNKHLLKKKLHRKHHVATPPPESGLHEEDPGVEIAVGESLP